MGVLYTTNVLSASSCSIYSKKNREKAVFLEEPIRNFRSSAFPGRPLAGTPEALRGRGEKLDELQLFVASSNDRRWRDSVPEDLR
jgi:hypothetical protein